MHYQTTQEEKSTLSNIYRASNHKDLFSTDQCKSDGGGVGNNNNKNNKNNSCTEKKTWKTRAKKKLNPTQAVEKKTCKPNIPPPLPITFLTVRPLGHSNLSRLIVVREKAS